MKDVVVVLGARVYLGNAIYHLAKRNSAAEIPDRNRFVLDINFDFFAGAHDEFIDGVIDDLLEQDVAAIVIMGTVANATDIHTCAQADMFQRGKCLDLALVVNVLVRFSHTSIHRITSSGLKSKVQSPGSPGSKVGT